MSKYVIVQKKELNLKEKEGFRSTAGKLRENESGCIGRRCSRRERVHLSFWEQKKETSGEK